MRHSSGPGRPSMASYGDSNPVPLWRIPLGGMLPPLPPDDGDDGDGQDGGQEV